MNVNEKLYEAFGELLYVVAMADGVIQPSERATLDEIVKQHPWGSTIQWSFNYEDSKDRNLDYVYQKVLDTCHEIGSHSAYNEMIDLLKKIAIASDGIDRKEQSVINSFSTDLTQRFTNDIEKLKGLN